MITWIHYLIYLGSKDWNGHIRFFLEIRGGNLFPCLLHLLEASYSFVQCTSSYPKTNNHTCLNFATISTSLPLFFLSRVRNLSDYIGSTKIVVEVGIKFSLEISDISNVICLLRATNTEIPPYSQFLSLFLIHKIIFIDINCVIVELFDFYHYNKHHGQVQLGEEMIYFVYASR